MRPDLLSRISDLAGEQVAEKIVSEYGGEACYIRKSLKPGNFVRCGDCAHHVLENRRPGYSPDVCCGITHAWTSLQHWRACDKFDRANPDFLNLAKHFDLPLDAITRIAAGIKSTTPESLAA